MSLFSLEDHFKSACEKHTHLKLLDSQWNFDRELISKALQNVGAMFPHYSRHDASHSRQIIVNIERLLGEKIKFLTATDTWLILESAYNHDIGMVITNKQIKDLDSVEFRDFVLEIKSQPKHALYEFASSWIDSNVVLPKGAEAHLLFNQYIQLISEWYRKKHPQNSSNIVNNPFQEIGLDSPRNELLPKRLFKVLADICRVHGDDFSRVMELPFSEAGMATEDCHPRYVACLLRIADLLDVDDNRFCPVMMRMCGTSLPVSSQAHFDKHHSIKHLRLDPLAIEAESECPDPLSYEATFDWFKWLENEHSQQMQNWHKIVPSEHLGGLPSLSPPIVKIKDPYLIIEDGKKPNFRVNLDAILELVRGVGFYPSKFDSVREILQNAVDATLINIWENHSDKIKRLNPFDGELKELYDQNSISVDFNEVLGSEGEYLLKITDRGIGISVESLKSMLFVGGISKNPKNRIINEMPVWFRPSGEFGLGLQSAYLLADKFRITSRNKNEYYALQIDFEKESDIPVIVKKIASFPLSHGSIFEVKIKINKFPEIISGAIGNPELQSILNEYDFIKSDSDMKNYEVFKIYESIINFNENSPIKISGFNNESEVSCEKFYYKDKCVLLSKIRFGESLDQTMFYFRGQPVNSAGTRFLPWISVNVDYYGHSAKEVMAFNREKFLTNSSIILYDEMVAAVISYIENNFSDMDGEAKNYASALYYLVKRSFFSTELMDRLKLFKIAFKNRMITMGDLIEEIEKGECKYLVVSNNHGKEKDEWAILNKFSEKVFDIISFLISDKGFYWQSDSEMFSDVTYTFGRADVQCVSDRKLKELLQTKMMGAGFGQRFLFPCWGKYRKLAVDAKIPWARYLERHSANKDYMVLPCRLDWQEAGKNVQMDVSKELVEWVFRHRQDSKVAKSEIESLYNDLKDHIQKIIFPSD